MNDQLISTPRETVQIQQKGQAARQEAQVQMRQIESDLKQALIENAANLRWRRLELLASIV